MPNGADFDLPHSKERRQKVMFFEIKSLAMIFSGMFAVISGIIGWLVKRSIQRVDDDLRNLGRRVGHVESSQMTKDDFVDFKQDLKQDLRDMREDTSKKFELLLGQVSEARAETNEVKNHLMGK